MPLYFGITFQEAQSRIYASDTPSNRRRKSYCPAQAKCFGCLNYETSAVKTQTLACSWSEFYRDLGFFRPQQGHNYQPLFDFPNIFPYLHNISGLGRDLSKADCGPIQCLLNMRTTMPGGERLSYCPPGYPCISCRVFAWRNQRKQERYRNPCMWNVFLPKKHTCHYKEPCERCVALQDEILLKGNAKL